MRWCTHANSWCLLDAPRCAGHDAGETRAVTGRGRVQPVPAATLCRRRAGLRVRARRARLRADLQGDRDGQLRAGRPDDARRVLRADREHHPGLALLGDDPVRHRRDGGRSGMGIERDRDPPGARLSDLHGGDDHDRRRLRAARRRHHGAGLGHRDLCAQDSVRRRRASASAAPCSRPSSLRPSRSPPRSVSCSISSSASPSSASPCRRPRRTSSPPTTWASRCSA